MKYIVSIVEGGGEKRKLLFNAAQQLVVAPERKEPAHSLAVAQALKYVDGQVYTGDINQIKPDDIANIDVYKGKQATAVAGPAGASGIIVITTKSGQLQPEVLAFNAKLAHLAPAAAPAPAAVGGTGKAVGPEYLAAPALAFITKTYPDARLVSVTELTPAGGGAPHYRAEIAVGRRPQFLYFDAQGQHVAE